MNLFTRHIGRHHPDYEAPDSIERMSERPVQHRVINEVEADRDKILDAVFDGRGAA